MAASRSRRTGGDVYLVNCKERSPGFQVVEGSTGSVGWFSYDGRLLALADPDPASNHITVIGIESGHRIQRTTGGRGPTAPGRALLNLFDELASENQIYDIQGYIRELRFSPDRRILATQTFDPDSRRRFIYLSDPASGTLLVSFETTINNFLEFSPDGGLLVVCPRKQRVLAWNTQNLSRKPYVLADEVPDWYKPEREVAFSPDGRFVTITEPKGLSLWRRT